MQLNYELYFYEVRIKYCEILREKKEAARCLNHTSLAID